MVLINLYTSIFYIGGILIIWWWMFINTVLPNWWHNFILFKGRTRCFGAEGICRRSRRNIIGFSSEIYHSYVVGICFISNSAEAIPLRTIRRQTSVTRSSLKIRKPLDYFVFTIIKLLNIILLSNNKCFSGVWNILHGAIWWEHFLPFHVLVNSPQAKVVHSDCQVVCRHEIRHSHPCYNKI